LRLQNESYLVIGRHNREELDKAPQDVIESLKNPVDAFTVFIIANWNSWQGTEPTLLLNDQCGNGRLVTVLWFCSLEPSVCGW